MQITDASHLDHGLSKAQVDHIRTLFADRDAFFIESFELPENLGTVPCGLYGPEMGDDPVPESEVSYEVRGKRSCASRLVNRDTRPTRIVTVIAGPHEDLACVLYTAFGGPLTPKEPGDLTLEIEKIQESRDFWTKHALAR
jgi:hypothetical protein